MRQPQITQEQIDAFLAALNALEPAQEGSAADQFFDAVSDSIKAKLQAGLTPTQILDLFKAQGIQLGTKRVAKFVRGLAPKKRKRTRRNTTVRTAGAVSTPAAAPPPQTRAEPKPPVAPKREPQQPPAAGPLVGAGAGASRSTTSNTPPRRTNASLGDGY